MKWSTLAAALAAASLLASQVVRAEEQADASEPALIEIELGDGTFSVHAADAPMSEVLHSLAFEAGFPLTEYLDSSGYSTTVDLDNVTWREGIAQLLRGWDYMLVMDLPSASPEKLIVIAKEESAVSEVAVYEMPVATEQEANRRAEEETFAPEPEPPSPETSMEEAIRIANELVVVQEDPLAAAIKKVGEAAAAAGESPDDPESAEEYADSLRALGDYQDPRLQDALLPAIASPNSEVRSAALEVMRYNPVENDDTSTLDRVYQMATSDPDPQVRRDALEVYVRYGDQGEVLSAVQALGRSDGPARDIAVREWIRIEEERSEAHLAERQGLDASGK